MGKILKGVAIAAVLIGTAVLTGGVSLVAAGTAGATTIAGVSFTATAFGGALLAAAAGSILTGISSQFFGPKMPQSQLSRLNLTFETSTPRKAVFGTTAMNTDIRYQEASGIDQEYIDYIVAVAAHKVKSIDKIWFEEKLAWQNGIGVTSTYSGYLTVDIVTEGSSSNYIAISSSWNSSCRLTGCAYVHFRIKRTGATNKVESPLVSGIPSRVTITGEGAPMYDPRRDSTAGGSGSHRANNQSTWGIYTDADDCDNPALQLLFWLLGWKINGSLSIGCGVPPERIDMESFITAANICDESVTLSTSGTQKRYRTSGTASDSDDRMNIINTFLGCMNGTLRDSNGKLALTVMKNDLADYVLDLDENDVLGEFSWNQTRGLTDSYNKARGRYVDPSDNSLYQLVDYTEVSIASPDGIERVMTVDLPYVEDGRRAQRIAKQVLERNQYRGMFSATFNAKALGCQVGDVVRLSFGALGWSHKLFRVISQEIRIDGLVPLALVEENAAIYAWDASDSAPITPTAPTIYNPLNDPFILASIEQAGAIASATATADAAYTLADGKIDTFYQTSMPTGTIGDLWFDTDDGYKLYRHNGTTFVTVRDTGIANAITAAAGAQATADGKVTTFYSTSTPTAQALGDLWYNSSTLILSRWSGSAWVNTATSGAPSGTNVGSIPANDVASTIKTGGGVADNNVSTPSILNNAVTSPVAAFTTSSITLTSGSDTTVQQATVDYNGTGVIIITAGATVNASSTYYTPIIYNIYRGSTQIASLLMSYNSVFLFTQASIQDIPPSAGTYTYYFKISATFTGSGSAENRSLLLLGAKK